MYDQTKQSKTKYSCTIYTMLNIIKYDFWVELKDSLIFYMVYYFEKIWALLPKWAYFSIIYPAMVKLIEWKTGFKLKVKLSQISKWLDDISMWGLWYKRLSSLSVTLSKDDWVISIEDIKEIYKSKKWSGHNHAFKQWNKSWEWTVVESWGGYTYQMDIKTLKEAEKLWIYYDNARTLLPADDRTKKFQKLLITRAKKFKRFISYEDFLTLKREFDKTN